MVNVLTHLAGIPVIYLCGKAAVKAVVQVLIIVPLVIGI